MRHPVGNLQSVLDASPGWGGGDSAYKGVEILVANFELNGPLKEANLGLFFPGCESFRWCFIEEIYNCLAT